MTRRELELWVIRQRDALLGRGVHVYFGFGPSLTRRDASAWASFTSSRGSGRLIRAHDGSSRVLVYAYNDGSCLRDAHHERGSEAQLVSIADLLTPRAVAR